MIIINGFGKVIFYIFGNKWSQDWNFKSKKEDKDTEIHLSLKVMFV